VSCGPVFDVDDNLPVYPNPNPVPPPPTSPAGDGYEKVKAYDARELTDYLIDTEISYTIILETQDNDIYLNRNISIVKPMKIIGSSGQMYTIHTTNGESGGPYYTMNLEADLELQNCGFSGYAGTSSSPPIDIKAGRTLSMTGNDSVLELRGSGSGNAIRTGSQVKLGEGASIVSESGNLLFKAGVEKLIVNGKVSLKGNLTVGPNAVLQIENGGKLTVEPGATLTLDNTIKELRLSGSIVVDRTVSPGGILEVKGLEDGTLLEKITGGPGSLSIENGSHDIHDIIGPFDYGANTIIKFSSTGITLEKRVTADIGSVVNLAKKLIIPKGKNLFVGTGVTFNVDKNLTLSGGELVVSGNVNVEKDTGALIIEAESNYLSRPKGSLAIETDGNVTVDSNGVFTDESVTWNNEIFSLPSYGLGSFIIKHGARAEWKQGNNNPVLELSGDITVRTVSGIGEVTFTGVTGTLAVKGGQALEGRLIVPGGATLTVNVNASVANDTFTVRAPNLIDGATTTSPAPQLKVTGGTVAIYTTDTDETPIPLSGSYAWKGSTTGWE